MRGIPERPASDFRALGAWPLHSWSDSSGDRQKHGLEEAKVSGPRLQRACQAAPVLEPTCFWSNATEGCRISKHEACFDTDPGAPGPSGSMLPRFLRNPSPRWNPPRSRESSSQELGPGLCKKRPRTLKETGKDVGSPFRCSSNLDCMSAA